MTYKELVEIFKDTTEELNSLFKSFGHGLPLDINLADDIIYPSVYVDSQILFTTDYGRASTTWNVVVTFLDRSLESNENFVDVESRLIEFSKKWFILLRSKLDVSPTVSSLVYQEKFQDRVYSVRCEFSVVTMDSECVPETNLDTDCV